MAVDTVYIHEWRITDIENGAWKGRAKGYSYTADCRHITNWSSQAI